MSRKKLVLIVNFLDRFKWPAKLSLGAIALFLSYLFNGITDEMYVLLVMQLLDIATGVTRAILIQDLSSRELYKGLLKKIITWLLIAMVAQISIILQLDYIKAGVVYFFIGSEALSILENATICGVVSPEWLKKILREWHGKVGESPIDSGGTGDSGSTG